MSEQEKDLEANQEAQEEKDPNQEEYNRGKELREAGDDTHLNPHPNSIRKKSGAGLYPVPTHLRPFSQPPETLLRPP